MKKLGHWDESGFLFNKEMLDGDFSFAVNFDNLTKHKTVGWIIFEFLCCEESQTIDPFSSHPNRYWHKNKTKFLILFELCKKLSATLYLVNYAKKGTQHEDKVLAIKVFDICEKKGIISSENKRFTRKEFSNWYRTKNNESVRYF